MHSSWTVDLAVLGRRWNGGGQACGSQAEEPHRESYGSRGPTCKNSTVERSSHTTIVVIYIMCKN